MERRCSYCNKFLGHKEPMDDTRITRGICDPCLFIIESTEFLKQAIRTTPDPSSKATDSGMSMLETVAAQCHSVARIRAFWKEFGNKKQSIREVRLDAVSDRGEVPHT